MRKDYKNLDKQIRSCHKSVNAQKNEISKSLLKSVSALESIQRSQGNVDGEKCDFNDLEELVQRAQFQPHLFAVLSLPKCGGSSIVATLEASFPQSMVRHLHAYSSETMKHFGHLEQSSDHSLFKQRLASQTRNSLSSRTIINQGDSRNVIFVAGVREPIALGVSLFFQQYLVSKNQSFEEQRQKYPIEEIKKAVENSEGLWFNLFKLDEWFETELGAATGHDVLAEPFPIITGFKVYRGGHGDLCICRMENMDSIADAIADVVQVPEFVVNARKVNTGKEKHYKDYYREVLNEITFSSDFIDRVYKTKYAVHFYSKSELDQFRARWSE